MERIFWVKNGELDEVNGWLQRGGRVKFIQPVSEGITSYGYHGSGGVCNGDEHDYYVGDIYTYVVVEFD